MAARIEYSEKYMDSAFEYRHVILPKELAKTLPKARLLSEQVRDNVSRLLLLVVNC